MKQKLDDEYLLGLSPQELTRLGFQHEIFAQDTHRLLSYVDIQQGHHVADLGCGPGYVSLELARLVGLNGKVTSIDIAEKNIKSLQEMSAAQGLTQIQTQVGSLDEISLEGSFDVVFSRWVFCYLKNPQKTLQEVKRVLKPGGKLVILDYLGIDHIVAPEFDEYAPVLEALNNSFNKNGEASLKVMRKLPTYVSSLGGNVEKVIPIQRVGRPHGKIWTWVETFYESFLPRLVEFGELDEKSLKSFWMKWNERKQDSNAYIFAMPMLGMIIGFD